jgi:hypothetical protein
MEIVPLRHFFPLKVVPLIEVLLYSLFGGGMPWDTMFKHHASFHDTLNSLLFGRPPDPVWGLVLSQNRVGLYDSVSVATWTLNPRLVLYQDRVGLYDSVSVAAWTLNPRLVLSQDRVGLYDSVSVAAWTLNPRLVLSQDRVGLHDSVSVAAWTSQIWGVVRLKGVRFEDCQLYWVGQQALRLRLGSFGGHFLTIQPFIYMYR